MPANRARATFGLIVSANYPTEADFGARLDEHREQVKLAMGYRPEEFAAMGVSLHDRLVRFTEGLAVMRAIWSDAPTWSFQGKHYDFDELPDGLRPKQKPHPPLWIAADVDAAVRRAGRLGAAWD